MSRPFVQVPSVADGDPFTEHMWDTYIRENVEFPADDPGRARRFWQGLLGVELSAREGDEG